MCPKESTQLRQMQTKEAKQRKYTATFKYAGKSAPLTS